MIVIRHWGGHILIKRKPYNSALTSHHLEQNHCDMLPLVSIMFASYLKVNGHQTKP